MVVFLLFPFIFHTFMYMINTSFTFHNAADNNTLAQNLCFGESVVQPQLTEVYMSMYLSKILSPRLPLMLCHQCVNG